MSEIALLRQQMAQMQRAFVEERQARRQFQEAQAAQIKRLSERVSELEREPVARVAA